MVSRLPELCQVLRFWGGLLSDGKELVAVGAQKLRRKLLEAL